MRFTAGPESVVDLLAEDSAVELSENVVQATAGSTGSNWPRIGL